MESTKLVTRVLNKGKERPTCALFRSMPSTPIYLPELQVLSLTSKNGAKFVDWGLLDLCQAAGTMSLMDKTKAWQGILILCTEHKNITCWKVYIHIPRGQTVPFLQLFVAVQLEFRAFFCVLQYMLICSTLGI